jgi:regulator of cell morphogenesis and NO signaling
MTVVPPDAEAAITISPQEASALVDLILDRYHAVHRAEVPELIRLARQVQTLHADAP